MKQKIVPFGETHKVYVEQATPSLIVVYAPEIREGFMLAGHGMSRKDLPSKNSRGKIVFEKGGPMGGYWKFYPETTKQ